MRGAVLLLGVCVTFAIIAQYGIDGTFTAFRKPTDCKEKKTDDSSSDKSKDSNTSKTSGSKKLGFNSSKSSSSDKSKDNNTSKTSGSKKLGFNSSKSSSSDKSKDSKTSKTSGSKKSGSKSSKSGSSKSKSGKSGYESRTKIGAPTGGDDRRYYKHRPSCCDPCDAIDPSQLDHSSQYYRECGQFLWDGIRGDKKSIQSWYSYCKAKQTVTDKMDVLKKLQAACFKDFWVVIDFKCPHIDICDGLKECNDVDAEAESVDDLVNYCSENTNSANKFCWERCNKCAGLIDTKSSFYKYCGQFLDQDQLKTWAVICENGDRDGRKQLLSMIYGMCRCSMNGSAETPDPCS